MGQSLSSRKNNDKTMENHWYTHDHSMTSTPNNTNKIVSRIQSTKNSMKVNGLQNVYRDNNIASPIIDKSMIGVMGTDAPSLPSHFYTSIVAGLSYDKFTVLIYEGNDDITIGRRTALPLLPMGCTQFYGSNHGNNQMVDGNNNNITLQNNEKIIRDSGVSSDTGASISSNYSKQTVVTSTSNSTIENNNINFTNENFFKRIGVVLHTKGNRFSRSSTTVTATDYYRVIPDNNTTSNNNNSDGYTYVKKDKKVGDVIDNNYSIGPAEASTNIRIGDYLYAINGIFVMNKSKKNIIKLVSTILNKKNFPLIIVWKHHENFSQVPFEAEIPLPIPMGEPFIPPNEYGIYKRNQTDTDTKGDENDMIQEDIMVSRPIQSFPQSELRSIAI